MEVLLNEKSFFSRALVISVAIHLLIVVAAVMVYRFSSPPKYGSLNTLNMVFDNSDRTETPTELPKEKPETKPAQPKDDEAAVKKKDESNPPPPSAPKGMIAGAFDAVDSSLLSLEYS